MGILVLDTAPASTPISLAEAKTHLRITSSDDDTYLTALIGAAVAHVDATGTLGRAMITQTWAEWFSQSPSLARLTMGPLQALTAVEYYDVDGVLQTDTLANFETLFIGDYSTCRPKDGFSWPPAQARPDAIKISYTAGYGDTSADVPAGVRHALLMLVAHWHQTRTAASEIALKDVPLSVDALLGNERVGWYG